MVSLYHETALHICIQTSEQFTVLMFINIKVVWDKIFEHFILWFCQNYFVEGHRASLIDIMCKHSTYTLRYP